MDLPPLNCGGCRKCCVGDIIIMNEGDRSEMYQTEVVDGRLVLARGADGNCVYLGIEGCRIHGSAPVACRTYDCRKHFLMREAKPGPLDLGNRPPWKNSLMEGQRRVAKIRGSRA